MWVWGKCCCIAPPLGEARSLTLPRLSPRRAADVSVSLLSLVVTACGLALFGVSLFVSWKLCWIPWRERGLSPGTKDGQPEQLAYGDADAVDSECCKEATPVPDAAMKISHTSPDIPLEAETKGKENCTHNARMQRQITEPTSSGRSVALRG